MGLEQGTAVSGSIIESPSTADLTDPRLPRAFKSWSQFWELHKQEIENIGGLKAAEVPPLSKEFAFIIGRSIGLDPDSYKEELSDKKITQLSDFISGKGNRIIFMRHAEQSPPEWIFSLSNPALRKIRMMQEPFNKQDLLTNNGLIDVFVTALALRHIQMATNRRVKIFSSENLRAKEAAYILSIVIPGSGLATLEGLNCISYKNEMDKPPMTDEDLLTYMPSGLMPWDLQLVDRLCKRSQTGLNQSEVIMNTISGLVDYGQRKNGNKLIIVLTHSQQIAEVLREVGKLEDPAARFPELTMVALGNTAAPVILDRGVLNEPQIASRPNMRKTLEVLGSGYEWYKVRRSEFESDEKIPFLVGPKPLFLSSAEGAEIERIGKDVVDFMQAANELYYSESDVRDLLDRGKPDILRDMKQPRYLFVRPDLLITNQGFSICELETSPFGLALAELLNRAYRIAGFNTMVGDDVLSKFLSDHTPSRGTIVYSQKTSSYAGQLEFLAKELFSGNGRRWSAENVYSALGQDTPHLYRGFYQHEYLEDLFINNMMGGILEKAPDSVTPSCTPHMEEKALLSLLWDKRWEQFLTHQLGIAVFQHLRSVIPPTWVVGQESFFALGLPSALSSSEELANLSRSKRRFVLKKSGFGSGSSWAEGVIFLQEKSSERAKAILAAAARDTESLYIIQEFRPAQERPMSYDKEGHTEQMKARIRITPYFSMIGADRGELIAIKATGCENTNYIHASTGSINTAVAVM